jgi:tRNA (cytidine/uridine-2'-O-)-methyltransferase
MIDVVLFEPEIPQNTGSIARMCAATGVGLHLAGGLGFALDDKYLKRAGLDYWQDVCMGVHRDLPALLDSLAPRPVYFLSKKARRLYSDVTFCGNEVFVFGSESVGLPEEVLGDNIERALRIPVRGVVRSLNLAAAVHIVVYHALAELGFPGIPGDVSP